VAAVAAVDERTAVRALALIRVEYEALPVYTEARKAMAKGAAPIHDDKPNNVLREVHQLFGDVEAGFAASDLVRERTFQFAEVNHAHIEPNASLADYEASLDEAVQKILPRRQGHDPLRLIWICGPSSSGKTTTTVKLTQRLEQHGLKFVMLNLDDYFWSLVEHPTDWINDRNFETPEALDFQLLNQHLRDLLEGRAIEKPVFSFKEGRRLASKTIKLERDQVLLLDCLHGFYPPITEGISPAAQFRLFIETQNVMYAGDGARKQLTHFTDIRLLRRILRDARHRNHSALGTLLHWHYVRSGELYSIIPFMGLADHVVNGGFPFDLPALKPFFTGEQSLLPPPEAFADYPGFLDARIRYERIRALLESVTGFTPAQVADLNFIPGDAVIREFIGGSTIPIPHNE